MHHWPTWTRALAWWYFDKPLDAYPEQPWDFGLEPDLSMHKDIIEVYPGLLETLQERKKALDAATR